MTTPTTPAAARLAAATETLWLVSLNGAGRVAKGHLAYESGCNIIAVCNGRAMGRYALPVDSVAAAVRCARCAAVAEAASMAPVAALEAHNAAMGQKYAARFTDAELDRAAAEGCKDQPAGDYSIVMRDLEGHGSLASR